MIYAATIFASAFLLFLVQPIIAKQITPWFGGSAAAWITCLVFFQLGLLAGYVYADLTTRKLKPRSQAILHIGLLVLSVASLPIIANVSWKPTGSEDPALRILTLLLATIGLPYFLLSTTGPLIQAWFARNSPSATVYRLFALSNFASLAALISYPFVLEPWIATRTQAYAWSIGYGVFALLCAISAAYSLRESGRPSQQEASRPAGNTAPPSGFDMVLWLALAAMGSWILLAVTNHITQNIASIPFLWLLPLSVYLLTFILCFESDGWYRRGLFLIPTAAVVGVCAWGLQSADLTLNIRTALPLYLVGLFLCCMFAHGELAKRRPAPQYLTRFYLMISLGGALGGMFVGLIAPHLFSTYLELGLGFVVLSILAAITLQDMPFLVWVLGIALAGVCGYFWNAQIKELEQDTRVMVRNFYGALRTKDTGPETSEYAVRRLIHGVILHGEQNLAPDKRMELTTYYGQDSGVGLALKNVNPVNQRVAVIGLGAGSLAAWGKSGDTYRFYEINPQVVKIAQSEFTYLRDSKAQIEISLGDARLNLERESDQQFDVMAIDAFSSDSIPVHLLTKEAMGVYLERLRPGGAIVFHVTNRYLKLAPVVKQIADSYGLYSAQIIDDAEATNFSRTDWVIVSRDRALIESDAISKNATPFEEISGLRLWTDDFNNLFQILK